MNELNCIKNKNINKNKKPDYLIYDIEKVIQIKPDLPNNWIQAPAGFYVIP